MMTLISNAIFLGFVGGIPLFAWFKKVDIFSAFIEGGKGGLETVVRIAPSVVGILVAIGMFRASGALELLSHLLFPVFSFLHIPTEILPLILVRPLSGAASTGVVAEIIQHHGGNAYISQLAATMMGATETTFYVIAIYFGSVGITKTRYAIPVGLISEWTGFLVAILVCRWFFL